MAVSKLFWKSTGLGRPPPDIAGGSRRQGDRWRAPARDELHAGRQAALDDGQVARGQVPVEVTVDYQLRHVYDRLGIRSREELVRALRATP